MNGLTDDHTELYDTAIVRRYFDTFDRITGHLGRVAAELETDGSLSKLDARVIGAYIQRLGLTFQSLGYKYLMTGRIDGPLPGRLTFDRHESGFPIAQELLVMANDAMQADRHLAGLPSEAEIKDSMIRQIVGDLAIPTRLQFTLSQRLYYESLRSGAQFWARNDPDIQWLGESAGRRQWLVHWAVYDTQTNLPVIYLLNVEDSGKTHLPRDDRRWPQVQAHLMAQSFDGLKLITIAKGFDTDFDDLYPKRLRRIHLGPMYSSAFTLQSGPISDVLAHANAEPLQDWALVWTVEDLLAEREETVKTGWFSTSERQIFASSPFAGKTLADIGATAMERMLIMPERPYQALAERNPPGFAGVRKFVVGAGGRVLPQR
ncbi:hypothetical protein SAMN05216227_1001161 [Pseudorhodobacter antarcticus]|uniref:Uncharacterized protein n=1 Tax=Pseudorhodobacter antarcticus TaxID=1077947 RepID=A0A1H8AJ03_9RHOB|nr:hypothetical protein [Pseudorhodobacter antarcticus]SEM70745.1 hypothetical protein SAMN05216227_1001161 [Pseudorhodobacter antarcticus]